MTDIMQIGDHDLAERFSLKRHPRSCCGHFPPCDFRGTFLVQAGHDGTARLFCASCNDREALAKAVVCFVDRATETRWRDQIITALRLVEPEALS